MCIDGAGGNVRFLRWGAAIYSALKMFVVQPYVVPCEPLSRLLSKILIIHVSPLQSTIQWFNDGDTGSN